MESSLVGNRYWVLRHGKSIPNERGLIVSSMENGVLPEFQLAPDGVAQARLAGELFLKMMEDLRERYFGPTFEHKSHDKYAEIWALDEKDPFLRPPGGESADDVVSRLAKAMESMEADYQGFNLAYNHIPSSHPIIDCLFPHGDPLQMLQNVFHSAMHSSGDGLAERIQLTRVASVLSQHRNFALLTGELRPRR